MPQHLALALRPANLALDGAAKGKGKGKGQGGRELRTARTRRASTLPPSSAKNNLYCRRERDQNRAALLTNDGSDVILNGKTDWVYYEEVYDRKAGYKHYWWSPDGELHRLCAAPTIRRCPRRR